MIVMIILLLRVCFLSFSSSDASVSRPHTFPELADVESPFGVKPRTASPAWCLQQRPASAALLLACRALRVL